MTRLTWYTIYPNLWSFSYAKIPCSAARNNNFGIYCSKIKGGIDLDMLGRSITYSKISIKEVKNKKFIECL